MAKMNANNAEICWVGNLEKDFQQVQVCFFFVFFFVFFFFVFCFFFCFVFVFHFS